MANVYNWRIAARKEGRVCRAPGCGQEISKNDVKDWIRRDYLCTICYKEFDEHIPITHNINDSLDKDRSEMYD